MMDPVNTQRVDTEADTQRSRISTGIGYLNIRQEYQINIVNMFLLWS